MVRGETGKWFYCRPANHESTDLEKKKIDGWVFHGHLTGTIKK
jgi:hypothetical protein